MKTLLHLVILISILFSASSCAPRETWDYVVMGVFIRSEVSTFPSHYAAALEADNNVKVVVHEQERGEPHEIYEHLKSDEDLRLAIKEAEVITYDFAHDWFDDATRSYLNGFCKGDDGQDCLRKSVQAAKDDWTGILDQIIEIRAGSPVILRVVVDGDWSFEWRNWNMLFPPMSPEEKQILIAYHQDVQKFTEEDAARRGIVVVRAFPEPYYNEDDPPLEYFGPDAIHFSDIGSQILVDEMKKVGYEFVVLK